MLKNSAVVLGKSQMKVNEIVVEALPGGGTLKGIARELSKKIGGDANHYATWGDHNNPKFFGRSYDPLANKKTSDQPQVAPQPTAPSAPSAPSEPQKSKLLKDFEVVHDNPVTIRWKNQDFQRNKMNGEWQNLGGKPPSEQLSGLLDQISPPQKNQGMANPFARSANTANTQQNVANIQQTQPQSTETPEQKRIRLQRAAQQQIDNPQVATPQSTPSQTVATPQSIPTQNVPPQPVPPAKIKITRNTDGSISVLDKLGKTWKSDPANRFWQDTSNGSIYRPGSEQYEKLNSLNTNLKESRALRK
jgi:hypothetical protein